MDKLLATLAALIAQRVIEYAVDWIKNPEHRDEIDAAALFLVDKFTDAVPGTWDDKLIDPLAAQILNGLNPASLAAQIAKQLPLFGGLFGQR